MRVLFTRFPLESRLGGAEIQTLSLLRGLREKGHAVSFLGSCPTLLELCAREHTPATELDVGPPPVSARLALSFFWRRGSMARMLEEAVERRKIDAVCMLSLSEKLLLTGFLRARGVRVIWIEHDAVGRWLRRNPWLGQLRRLSRRAITVCVSELSRRLYLQLGWKPADVVAIPNGVDPDRFAVHDRPLRHAGLRLGCVARLAEDKGVDLLLEAVADLPEVTLDVVGEGPEEGYLRRLTEEMERREGVEPARVRIVPSVPDLGAFYADLDALVLPSRSNDPFGLVAAEAMLLGVPVLVTDACGIAESLEDGTDAIVAEAGSADALRAALRRLADAGLRERIGQAGQRTALRLFTAERMADAYEALLADTAR